MNKPKLALKIIITCIGAGIAILLVSLILPMLLIIAIPIAGYGTYKIITTAEDHIFVATNKDSDKTR